MSAEPEDAEVLIERVLAHQREHEALRLEVAAWRALAEYGVTGHWMPPRNDLGVGWATTGSRNTNRTELPEYPTFGHGDDGRGYVVTAEHRGIAIGILDGTDFTDGPDDGTEVIARALARAEAYGRESAERAAETGKAQAAPAVEAWVPCEERMPEKRAIVMFVPRYVDTPSVGYTNGKVWVDMLDVYADGPQEYDAANVTHWRTLPPLPPPPKESR